MNFLKKLATPKNIRIASGILTLIAGQVASHVSNKNQEELINAKIAAALEDRKKDN